MIRMGLLAFIVAGTATAFPAAQAASTPPENEDSRFTFHRGDEGAYLRLDGRSGQVSVCTRRPVGWACQVVPDERAAMEVEIARLQAESAALKKELLTHNLALPSGIKPDPPPAKVEEPRVKAPREPEFKRVVTFIENVWRRLVEMIVNVQKGLLKKT